MQSITTIGLDIAKSVFQVHGVDANGLVVIRRQLKRRYVLKFFEKLVGIEACASSHHWSRSRRRPPLGRMYAGRGLKLNFALCKKVKSGECQLSMSGLPFLRLTF